MHTARMISILKNKLGMSSCIVRLMHNHTALFLVTSFSEFLGHIFMKLCVPCKLFQ